MSQTVRSVHDQRISVVMLQRKKVAQALQVLGGCLGCASFHEQTSARGTDTSGAP